MEATLCGLSIFLVISALLTGGLEKAADVFGLVAVFLLGVALLGLVERLDSLLYDLAGRVDDVLHEIRYGLMLLVLDRLLEDKRELRVLMDEWIKRQPEKPRPLGE